MRHSRKYDALISNAAKLRILRVRLLRSSKIRHFVPLKIVAAIVPSLEIEATEYAPERIIMSPLGSITARTPFGARNEVA
jgi:hypothetical protein